MAFMDIPKTDFAALKLIHGRTVKYETVAHAQAADSAGEDSDTWTTSLTTTAIVRPSKFADKEKPMTRRTELGIKILTGRTCYFTAGLGITEQGRIYVQDEAKYFYVINVVPAGNCDRIEAKDAEPGD